MVSQIFDRNKDGQVSLKELKKVTEILGTILTKDEVDEFMKEADKVQLTDDSEVTLFTISAGWRRYPGY